MNRTRRMVGIAWLLAGLFLQAGGLGAAELPRPSDANRLWFSMTYSLAGDPAEIAAIKTRYGRAIYAPLCFSHFLEVSLPWGQEGLPPATSMSSFRSAVETLVDKAQTEGVGLHLTLCYGIARNVWDYAAAKKEDLRNAQWYSDNRLASPQQLSPGAEINDHVWTTPSRYARKLRENLRTKTLEAFSFLKEKGGVLPPDKPLIVSGPGEAELNFGRINEGNPLASTVCDYSPFAVLEFRDWITHEGLYAPGQPYGGQGWANGGANYQGPAGLARFNADFATAFTSWELEYYRWSLANDPEEGALPWTAYDPATGLVPMDPAQFLEGGFDPPRTLKVAGADPFWDLWMTFRQALIAHYVADVAGWARETGFPMDRYFTHQIPADYLFGSKAGDSPQNARHYTSASPLSTAYPPDGTSAGVTIYDINFGTWVARTSEHVLAPLRAGGRPWAALEYNPEVVPASGVSLLSFASPLLEGFSAAVSAKAPALATPRAAIAPVADIYQQLVRLHDAAPTLISFYDWISTSEWQFKDTNRGLALDQYFAQVRDTGRAPLATRFTPPALSQVAGEYQPGGALRLAWSPEIWPGQGHLWPDWGQFLTFRVFSGNTPDFALSAATASWDTLDPTWLVEAPGNAFYRVAALNRDGVVGPLSVGFGPEIPVIRLDRTTLCFAAAGSAITAGQAIRIGNAGSGTLHWTATPSSSWIVLDRSSGTGNSQVGVSVAPAGLPVGTHVGTVTIADPAAANAPQEVVVRLVVLARGGNPYGVVDTPTNNQTGITGNTPVTGWALDDIEVTAVRIYRDPMPGEPVQPNGKVYIGDASFVAGARPDVEAAYATTPFASRAGWGYMML
ncbi:MAG TPA: hypothetical protein PKK12_06905, partial [Candidatus Aminicenantes bacterium]|nr:hypothetical protein [Candidatus Aminicenantes bacterium]